MVFLNWKELPWYWYGFDHFAFAALMIIMVPGVLAFAFGWLAFRSRVTGVYLSIITQALTYALWLAFFRNDMGFGGNNGMTDFKDLLGIPLQTAAMRRGLYVASVLALGLGYLHLPLHRDLEAWPLVARSAGRAKPGEIPRLLGGACPGLRLHRFRHARWRCWSTLCAASRHHQPK